VTLRHTRIESQLGCLVLVAEGQALRGCYFSDQRYLPDTADFGVEVDAEDDALLRYVSDELARYFAGELRDFTVPLAPVGDEFSERCWAMLREIPYGETTSYGELADALGNRKLAQRVGQAVGHNPIGVIIPCHRVVGADGSLTGYAGGLERKRWLLELEEPEAASASRLF